MNITVKQKSRNIPFARGLASDGEPTSGFFKLQKIRTWRKVVFLIFAFVLIVISPTKLFAQDDGFDVNLYVVNGCNNDFICQPGNGEDSTNCPNDCVPPPPDDDDDPPGAVFPPPSEDINLYNIRVEADFEEATIRWESNVPTATTLRYGTTSEVKDGSLVGIGYMTDHSMKIINLNPGTMYFFAIEARGLGGKMVFMPPAYFFTKFRVNTIFPLNVLDARATTQEDGILLSWRNPPDENFSYVRIMRHEDHFRGNPHLGKLIYEGDSQSFLDTDVKEGKMYYYSLFARNTEGDYSSGVGVSARAYKEIIIPDIEDPGVEEPGVEEPGIEEPGIEEPGVEEPGVEEPTTGEEPEQPTGGFVTPEEKFYAHQYNQLVRPLDKDTEIEIKSGESTIVDTNQEVSADHWVRVTHQGDEVIGNFLFSFNKNSGRYQAVFPPLPYVGRYHVEVFDYENEKLKRVAQGYVRIDESLPEVTKTLFETLTEKIDFNWLYILILILFWLIIPLLFFRRRRKRLENEVPNEDFKKSQ